MRIAFVTLQYPPDGVGGIGTYVETVAGLLAGAGHDVTVVCAARGHQRSTEVVGGVRVERFPVLGPERLWRRWVAPGQTLRVRLHHALSSAWALRRAGRFDVVEAPEWKAQGLLLRVARRGRVVVHLHLGLELELSWNGSTPTRGARLSCLLERWTARLAHARTATSEQTRRFPDGSTWLGGSSVEVVAPPLRSGPWAACAPVVGTAPVVLFVGRLERRKAPEVLLEALGRLAPEVPHLRAVFVGSATGDDGRAYADSLRSRAAELGVGCELHDPTADPAALLGEYARARVVAVPSRFETLSMVAIEAMACGRPVVLTDRVGAAEWLDEPLRSAAVVPAGDPTALADALGPHLVDPDHAARTGDRMREFATGLTDPARVVADRLAVYERTSR